MKKKFIAIIILIAVVVLCGLAFFFLLGDSQMPNEPNNPNNNEDTTLPEGWTANDMTACSIQIPMPPRQDPYVSAEGEYWRFQQNTQENTVFFPNIGIVIFQNPEAGGSGYVAGSVVVSCRPNADNNSVDEIAEQYGQYLADQSRNVPEEAKLTLRMGEKITLWNKEVQVVSIEGGMFNPEDKLYVTAHNGFAYIISKPAMSTNAFVRQTTEDIFAKLNFK